MSEEKTKRCSKCKETKSISEFYKANKTGKIFTYCKECMRKYNKSRIRVRGKIGKNKIPITSRYVAEVERAIIKAKNNPKTFEEVAETRKLGVHIRPPRSPDRTKIRDRKKKRTTSLTRKESFFKGFFIDIYSSLAALGLSDVTIARLGGRKPLTFKDHLDKDPEIDEEYQRAMDELELRLSHWLIVMAKGYEIEEVKIRSNRSPKTGDWVEVEKTHVRKHHPGDIQALIFYLTNRFPDKWKVSRELLTGKAQTYDSKPGERNRKAIESVGREVLGQDTDKSEGKCLIQNEPARLLSGSEQTDKK